MGEGELNETVSAKKNLQFVIIFYSVFLFNIFIAIGTSRFFTCLFPLVFLFSDENVPARDNFFKK